MPDDPVLKKFSLFCTKTSPLNPGSPIARLMFILLLAGMTGPLSAQNWEFAKEKNGIKMYTRKEANTNLKSFRGVMEVHSTMARVTQLVGNVKNNDWWDKNVKEIKILYFEENKHFKYYLVYDAPWPLEDRDLCVDAQVTIDPVTGRRELNAKPIPNLVPERSDRVRIKNYWQRWIIQPMENGMIRLILEGSVDPGGIVPTWIVNMVITDTPLNVMNGIKERVEIKQ